MQKSVAACDAKICGVCCTAPRAFHAKVRQIVALYKERTTFAALVAIGQVRYARNHQGIEKRNRLVQVGVVMGGNVVPVRIAAHHQ